MTSWDATSTRGAIVQVAYAVDDVRVAAARWHATTGAGPFFVRDHIPLSWAEHAGEPAVFDHSTALGQWGPVMVELVAHHRLSPPAMEQRMRRETPGLHHVAWFVDDIDAERARLVAAGGEELLLASTGTATFAFLVPPDPLGHLVEVYEPGDALRERYRMVREASLGWDGTDPVRELA